MRDSRGVEITAGSEAAVEAFDLTLSAYMRFGTDIGQHLKAALTADPEMPMAHCLKAYFFHLTGSRPMQGRAQKALVEAESHSAGATERELHHLAALRAWCRGDLEEATREWETILQSCPLDLLAVKMCHFSHFYMGRPAEVRASLERVEAAWNRGVPDYGYFLSMRAFGLEETGDYDEAERIGREAIALNPMDGWAAHAVVHVMEMQDRARDGIEWLEGLEAHWGQAANFRYHLWWHRALLHLGLGEYDQVLSIYDEQMYDPDSHDYLDISNDASILQRLEICGVDVGERWGPVAETAIGHAQEHVLAFADVHFLMALAGAGETEAVRTMLDSMRNFSENSSQESHAAVLRDVGVPLGEALLAYRNGDFGNAADRLRAVRDDVQRIGGSHAQRDIFEMLLIDAAEKSGRRDTLDDLLTTRLEAFPSDRWTQDRLRSLQ